MRHTIGNPLSWTAREVALAGRYVAASERALHGARSAQPPVLRNLTTADLMAALRDGARDFAAMRTDVVFLVLIYPLVGAGLFLVDGNANLLHLILPVLSGLALLGPVAAVGLYELSRRRERGEEATLLDALAIRRSPVFGAVATLGLMLFGVFLFWVVLATTISQQMLGVVLPWSLAGYLAALVTTAAGLKVLVLIGAIGLVFAVAVLAATLFAFPMLMDRDVGLPVAVASSLRLARRNPREVALWGAIVAAGLILGALPALLGLVVVLPILGHATWHLYRRAVA